MKILVINAGSSSLKYQLFDMENEEVLAKGICENIGLPHASVTHKRPAADKYEESLLIPDHDAALSLVLRLLTDKELGVITNVDEIAAVGHRFAHGGEKLRKATVLGEEEMAYLRSIVPINPLHGPGSISGVEACRRIMPNVPHVGVFDTAFHSTIPDYAYIYPVPYEWYEDHKVRRYGFHGTSHRYVSLTAAEKLGKKPEELRTIVCHLGSGSSITAIQNGKVVDTSMGFTPQEGLPMGTRSGTIDPTVVTYMMRTLGISPDEMDSLLNKKSGLLGISGVSSDCYNVLKNEDTDYRCKLAIQIWVHYIKKIIGSYIAEMNGVDVLVFTAGIGENDRVLRNRICADMDFLGIKIDTEKNDGMSRGSYGDITAADSRVKVLVVPTDEERMIARETRAFV